MDSQEKAKALLQKHLSPSQRTTYKRDGCFFVVGQKSGLPYLLSRRNAMDKAFINEYRPIVDVWFFDLADKPHCKLPLINNDQFRLCVNSAGLFPDTFQWMRSEPVEDVLLSTKLMIEGAETDFLNMMVRYGGQQQHIVDRLELTT